jgi:O-acetyl-ADP-ribose deacetylase
MEKPFTPPTPEQIDRLLAYLPVFQQPDFIPSTDQQVPEALRGSLMGMGQEWAPDLSAFHKAVYEEGFAYSFPWVDWQDRAEAFVKKPEMLATADLQDICRLLTTHVRKERFCEGHLPAMMHSGHITKLLERLQEIRHAADTAAQAK